MHELRAIILVLITIGGVASGAAAEAVHRRGAEPTLRGKVTALDDGGVTLRSEHGTDHVVPWDRVRALDLERTEPALARYLATATDLWRARSRVERRDTALAEPLLERLWAKYHGQTHETALVVAEGLLRCRIDRQAHAAALVPALEVARLHRRNIRTASYSMLPDVLDETTHLCPFLAPAWLPSRALVRLRQELERYDPQGDPVVARLAALYHRSLDGAAAPLTPPIIGVIPAHPGIQFLETVLDANAPAPEQRDGGRRRLAAMMEDLPGWAQAWARYAVGVSLLAESGRGRRQRGVLSLSYLPALHGPRQPWLSGLALARMIDGLTDLGAARQSALLRAELERAYPHHPVVELLASGAWPPPAAPDRPVSQDKDSS